jgi:CHAT domain-containing protein
MGIFCLHHLGVKTADPLPPDAFRVTQLEMREKYQNPYFWAGFVLTE